MEQSDSSRLFVSFFQQADTKISSSLHALDLFMDRGVRPKTRRIDEERLRPFLQNQNTITTITKQQIDDWFEKLAERFSYTSRQSYAQTTKTFFNWCIKHPDIDLHNSPASHLKSKRRRSARNKAAPQNDLDDLLKHLQTQYAQGDKYALRDWLAIQLVSDNGNRLTELTTVTTKAMLNALKKPHMTSKGIAVYTTYSDEGKMGSVPIRFTEHTAALFRQWQTERPRKNRHRVFVTLRRPHTPLTTDGFTQIFVRRCKEIAVHPFRTHAIRHLKGTKITNALGPRAAATTLNITVETAQLHYYDEDEKSAIEATTI